MSVSSNQALVGRAAECAAVDRVLGEARAGRGSVLVLRGEAGVGKSVLLDYLAGQAADCAIARAAGVEAEVELSLAGLQQLLSTSMLAHAERLAKPQRAALQVAFGMCEGPAPDRFLVAMAALGLLTLAADDWCWLACQLAMDLWNDDASAAIAGGLAGASRRELSRALGNAQPVLG